MTTLKATANLISSETLLKKLTLSQIRRIDEMLTSMPDYGEVRLIVQRGEVRYINKVESYKVGDEARHRE